jgi:hypothetical protein
MVDFLTFTACLIFGFTVYSLRDYSKYALTFYKMKFMKFNHKLGILIANENTNEEFVIVSNFNFVLSPNFFLQFDIWALADLHRLYWLIKFHKQAKKIGLLKKLGK